MHIETEDTAKLVLTKDEAKDIVKGLAEDVSWEHTSRWQVFDSLYCVLQPWLNERGENV